MAFFISCQIVDIATLRAEECITFAIKKEMKNKKITFSHSGVGNVMRVKEEIVATVFERMFAAIGATRDKFNDTYLLNGIEDITEEEMVAIFCDKEAIDKLDVEKLLYGCGVRTIVPCRGEVGIRLKNRPLKGAYCFARSGVEVLKFGEEQILDDADAKELLPVERLEGTFCGCAALRVVYPMDVSSVGFISGDTFEGCENLRELRLCGLGVSLDVASSPLLSYKSLLYIVDNKNSEVAIEVAVNPATYKYLHSAQIAGDGVGGRVDEWDMLLESASAKGVKFSTPAFVAYIRGAVLYINRGEVCDESLIIAEPCCFVSEAFLNFI